jgi:hypothetical protein
LKIADASLQRCHRNIANALAAVTESPISGWPEYADLNSSPVELPRNLIFITSFIAQNGIYRVVVQSYSQSIQNGSR